MALMSCVYRSFYSIARSRKEKKKHRNRKNFSTNVFNHIKRTFSMKEVVFIRYFKYSAGQLEKQDSSVSFTFLTLLVLVLQTTSCNLCNLCFVVHLVYRNSVYSIARHVSSHSSFGCRFVHRLCFDQASPNVHG